MYSYHKKQNFRVLPLAPNVENYDMAQSTPSCIAPKAEVSAPVWQSGQGDKWIRHGSQPKSCVASVTFSWKLICLNRAVSMLNITSLWQNPEILIFVISMGLFLCAHREELEAFFPLSDVPAPQLKMVDPPPTSIGGGKSQLLTEQNRSGGGICDATPMDLEHRTHKFVNNFWRLAGGFMPKNISDRPHCQNLRSAEDTHIQRALSSAKYKGLS